MQARLKRDWLIVVTLLAFGWLFANAPAVQAEQSPDVWHPPTRVAESHVDLFANWVETVDNFFMRNRNWILTMGLVVVILGFALLYKGWK